MDNRTVLDQIMTRTRRAVEDAIGKDIDKVDGPTLRALFAIATNVDDIGSKIDKATTRLTNALTAAAGTIIVSAILAALALR